MIFQTSPSDGELDELAFAISTATKSTFLLASTWLLHLFLHMHLILKYLAAYFCLIMNLSAVKFQI